MKNDLMDLMLRCTETLKATSNEAALLDMEGTLREMSAVGKEHIEEAVMKGFITSVEKFEKYVRGQK